MLNETALRLPSFQDDLRVKLADGQEWSFPRPVLRFGMTKDSSGKSSTRVRYASLGPEYLTKFLELHEARSYKFPKVAEGQGEDDLNEDQDDTMRAIERIQVAQFDLIIELLRSNYDLNFDQASEVVSFDLMNESEKSIFDQILALASGLRPKVSATGSSQV